jgi:HKD family nuclease
MTTQLITNADKTLAAILRDEVPRADSLTVCVAFLKQSGLTILLPGLKRLLRQGGNAQVIAGLDFYLTEPYALRQLSDLAQAHPSLSCKVFESAGNATFHPKMYCVTQGTHVALVIGSSNLTSGGLGTNTEACTLTRTDTSAEIYTDFLSTLQSITTSARCSDIEPILLSQYTRKFDTYHKHFRQFQRTSRAALAEIPTVSAHKLRQYVGEYLASPRQQSEWTRRCADYVNARQILDGMLTTTFAGPEQFLAEYEKLVGKAGQRGRWHSGSLFRLKKAVAAEYRTFLDMLRDVKAHIGAPPGELLALGKTYTDRVKGLHFNVLTEIMNTYDPQAYTPLNANPVDSLKEIGMQKFPPPGTFKPETYAEFVALLKKIQQFLGLTNLSHVDHFLNYVYWKYVKHQDYD